MRRMTGFSIIELMVALVLGLLVAIAAATVFVQGKRSYGQNEQLSRTQENGRFAVKLLQRDLSMAGFFAQMSRGAGGAGFNVLGRDAGLNITPACGNASNLTPVQNMLILADGQTPNAVANAFPCLNNVQPGTDAIAIKRVADNPDCTANAGAGSCGTDNELYVLTNGVTAWIHDQNMEADPVGDTVAALAPRSDWEYLVFIYFIRSFSVTAGDGIPTLCRMALGVSGAPANQLAAECLAEGIEDLQIEIGVDNNADRIPDFYIATPTAAQLDQTETVKFYLLARSTDTLPGITNDVSYTLGSNPALGPFGDRFLRRVYSSSVQVRNI